VAERAADAAIEDFETNRKIEALIDEHRERRARRGSAESGGVSETLPVKAKQGKRSARSRKVSKR
jgi:hypothetical protein